MTETSFRPTLFLKKGCPFCFKVRLFMLESGLSGSAEVHEFEPGTDGEVATRAVLEPHLSKVSFPAAELEPGRFVTESDEIIDFFAKPAGIDVAELPVLRNYLEGPFAQIGALSRENRSLKAATV